MHFILPNQAMLYTCEDCYRKEGNLWRPGSRVPLEDSHVHHIDIGNNNGMMNEIMVPTCSYRMGVPRMGYGFATLGKLV